MKRISKASLAAAVLCLAACSPGPGDEPEPSADASTSKNEGGNATAGNDPATDAEGAGTKSNPLADRMRLPDMEKLPSDKELATNKPKPGGGGVIARPPSE